LEIRTIRKLQPQPLKSLYRVDKDRLCSRIIEDVGDGRWCECRVDRYIQHTRKLASCIGKRPVRRIVRQERGPIAFPQPQRIQTEGDISSTAYHLGRGDRLPTIVVSVDKRVRPVVSLRRLNEKFRERRRFVLKKRLAAADRPPRGVFFIEKGNDHILIPSE